MLRRKLFASLLTLAIVAAMMVPLALTSYAQTPAVEPNTDISGTIDVAMVANPQMVALQELVEAGGKLYSTSKEVKVTVGGCGG